MPENTPRVNVAAPLLIADATGATDAPVLIYATFASLDEARRIGGELVGLELAACVNLVPGMRSVYRWQGRIEEGQEIAAIVKTRRRLAGRVAAAIRVLHSYTNPAVVVLPVEGGAEAFLEWIVAETAGAVGA